MSGFTGSGYPKAVPMALARRISDANLRGQKFQVSIFTGASTGPELDGALAMAGGIHLRLPYQSDPETRKRINAGEMEYMDIHLSHVAQFVEYGFLGKLDLALIEVTAVLEDGRLVPSSSLGNNKTWIEQAEHVIIEVNSWQPAALEGMHDIYYGLQPPSTRPPTPPALSPPLAAGLPGSNPPAAHHPPAATAPPLRMPPAPWPAPVASGRSSPPRPEIPPQPAFASHPARPASSENTSPAPQDRKST